MSKTPVVPIVSVDEMEDRKRALAYQMWEDEGRPEGKAAEHWGRACLLVMELDSEINVAKPGWLKRSDQDKSQAGVSTLQPLEKPAASENNAHGMAKRSAA
jgi:Protein of unknown function (DUF2934)